MWGAGGSRSGGWGECGAARAVDAGGDSGRSNGAGQAAGNALLLRFLTYAHVWSRMLTYAHVCSRMLTYDDLC